METPTENILVCKICARPVLDIDYFCPNCGKKLKEKPVSLSVGGLIWLLVLSTLLPPLGIGLTIRYIRSEDEKIRMIGWISLGVTMAALIISIALAKSVMDSVNQQINSQMQNYSF